MRPLLYLFCISLLCQCAAKHQPIVFAPYFSTGPQAAFTTAILEERRILEAKVEPTALEKKRLLEIYYLELASTKPQLPRYDWVTRTSARLAAGIKAVEDDLAKVQRESRDEKEEKPSLGAGAATIETPELKQLYRKVYTLWNADSNDEARAALAPSLMNLELKAKVSAVEWYKLLSLDMRIALDTGDLTGAEARYSQMVAQSDCATETADAGFALAFHYFGSDNPGKALSILENQCEPPTQGAFAARKRYWLSRFAGPQSPSGQEFREEARQVWLPGYYQLLSRGQLKESLELILPTGEAPPGYFKNPISVSPRIHSLWLSAEIRLANGLKRDAGVFLHRAAYLLKEGSPKDNLFALLYTAHLLHAAGSHLEALRIYSVVFEEVQKTRGLRDVSPQDFASVMFPRPYPERVEWVARQWNVDPDLIYALMRQESAFNPMATSAVDARGLMQLMPFVARALASRWRYERYYSDKTLFQADENLKLAAFHLHQLHRYVPHVALMAAAYNAGYARVYRWWRRNGHMPLDVFIELIPIQETRNYVKLVLRNYLYYRAIRGGGKTDTDILTTPLPPVPSEPDASAIIG